jgi:transcriptional regulator with XRE-family HTH domain
LAISQGVVSLMATLKRLREEAMLTGEELAEACGVTRQAVWKWEHAQAKPSIPIQRKLMAIFGVSATDLLQAIEETRKEVKGDRAAA